MRLALVLVAVFAAAALAVGLGARGDEDAAPTTSEPAATTPDAVTNAIWERSYSECASSSVLQLAAQYKVDQTDDAVSAAVARDWNERFEGGPDAIAVGREGCLQGLASR